MRSAEHWEEVYRTKQPTAVSWYQPSPEPSLRVLNRFVTDKACSLIDVGGGASNLVDTLLKGGWSDLTVLDIAAPALQVARERLGEAAETVKWEVADIANWLPSQTYDIWHDRAVFHFLTTPEDRAAYVGAVLRAVKPGGHVIVATFAEDGPTQCSGLPVMRYRADELHAVFGGSFLLLQHSKEVHHTPFGTDQQFVYCYCRKVAS